MIKLIKLWPFVSTKSHCLLQFYPTASFASGYFPSFIPNRPRIDLHGSQNQRETYICCTTFDQQVKLGTK